MTTYNIVENVLKTFELSPVDNRKSFYGKCRVIETRSRTYLQSYNTMVCYWDNNTSKFARTWSGYSVTTMRHINAFMRYLGLNLGGKTWWNSLEYKKEYTLSEILNI